MGDSYCSCYLKAAEGTRPRGGAGEVERERWGRFLSLSSKWRE